MERNSMTLFHSGPFQIARGPSNFIVEIEVEESNIRR